MKAIYAASLFALATADSLKITWSDCGSASTHGKATAVEPSELPLGAETAIVGSLTTDKSVSGGSYDMEMKAGAGIVDVHFKGNNCEAKEFDLPLGVGSFKWDGMACPMAAGDNKIGIHATFAAALPAGMASATIAITAVDQDSEDLICVDMQLDGAADAAPAEELGGSLAITWSDCGAEHGKATDVEPSALPLGAETAIIGSLTTNKAVSGGTYDMEMKAGAGIVDVHFKGNNCEAKEFDLPLGVGSFKWDGMACPMGAGDNKIGIHATFAAALPAGMASATIAITSNDQDGEGLICVNMELDGQAAVIVV